MDRDQFLENVKNLREEGKSINEIFAEEGEPHFRTLEREITGELSAESGQVVSTGGGIVLNPDNISDYEKTGLVVCLLASAEEILDRVQHDDTRPLLAGDKQDKILQLLETRRPLYESITHNVDTNGLAPEAISAQIIALYETNKS